MNYNITKVKLTVTIPSKYLTKIRESIFKIGGGQIGSYTNCSLTTKCTGTFKPTRKSHPFIGKKDRQTIIKEENLEIICNISLVKPIINIIKKTHPYEEPVINIIPLLDELDFK